MVLFGHAPATVAPNLGSAVEGKKKNVIAEVFPCANRYEPTLVFGLAQRPKHAIHRTQKLVMGTCVPTCDVSRQALTSTYY